MKLLDERMERIGELISGRGQIVKMKVEEKDRLKKAREEKVRGSILKVLPCLEESLLSRFG